MVPAGSEPAGAGSGRPSPGWSPRSAPSARSPAAGRLAWGQLGADRLGDGQRAGGGRFVSVQQTRGGHRGANALVAGGIAPTSTAPGQSLLPERPDLFQLPPDIGDFTGREAALAELLSLLKPDGAAGTALSLVVIAGKAGVGSSANCTAANTASTTGS